MQISATELSQILEAAFHKDVDTTLIAVTGSDRCLEVMEELGIHLIRHPMNGTKAVLGTDPILAEVKANAFLAYIKRIADYDHQFPRS